MLPRPPDKTHKRTRQPFKAHRALWNRAGYGQRSAVAAVVLPRAGLRGDVFHLPFLLTRGRVSPARLRLTLELSSDLSAL